jgi:hypothetical protein
VGGIRSTIRAVVRPSVRTALMALVAVVLSATAPRTARSDVCDPACDVDCATCCKKWTIRAVCTTGEAVSETGAYPTPRAAQTGAAAEAVTDKCADGSEPRWAPYCAPENAIASPVDPPAAAKLVVLRASIAQRLHDVRDGQAAIIDFAGNHLLYPAGQQRIGDVATALRHARSALADALATAQQLTSRVGLAEGDVESLDASTADARKRADAAVAKARALIADSTIIDSAAEARQKKLSK